MSKYLRFGLVAFSLALLMSVISVPEAKAQILTEILKRMDINNKSLQSVRSDITMVKYESALKISDTYAGSTSYLPKTAKRVMYARIDWKTENGKPNESSLAVIGDEYQLYKPKLNQVITGNVSKSKNNESVGGSLGFMNMSKDQLKANYTVVYIGEEQLSGGALAWHLELTPKAAANYKSADIWVDGDGMPRQSRINEKNNDSTTIQLSSIQKNVTIKGEVFTLNYDKKKVKIIKS